MAITLQDKVVLVTGATSGIGEATALALAEQGARVVIVSRSPQKCAATVNRIKQATGNTQIDYIVGDLSVMAEVREVATQFRRSYDRLDVLVNNAGAMFMARQVSADGYEMMFALNHLSYFLLTNLLLDMLQGSAPARIVNVASDAHKGQTINFDDLQAEQKFSAIAGYGGSKLMNIMFTYELARRLNGTGVTANALHPGFVSSNIGVNGNRAFGWLKKAINVFSLSPEDGAQTSVYLASSPEVEGVTGQYFVKSQAVPSSDASYAEAAQKRLWDVSAELVGLPVADSVN